MSKSIRAYMFVTIEKSKNSFIILGWVLDYPALCKSKFGSHICVSTKRLLWK